MFLCCFTFWVCLLYLAVFCDCCFWLRFCELPVTSGWGFGWLLSFLCSVTLLPGLIWIGFLLLDCRALPCGFVMVAIWNCHFLVFGFFGFLRGCCCWFTLPFCFGVLGFSCYFGLFGILILWVIADCSGFVITM